MIWPDGVSIEGFLQKVIDWYSDPEHFISDPPIDAQYALDVIFKVLIDDRENYPYLTTIPESNEQVNSIMVDVILSKYSRRYCKIRKRMLGK